MDPSSLANNIRCIFRLLLLAGTNLWTFVIVNFEGIDLHVRKALILTDKDDYKVDQYRMGEAEHEAKRDTVDSESEPWFRKVWPIFF